MTYLRNRNARATSIQVSRLELLPAGKFEVNDKELPVLIKNITADNVTAEIELVDNPGQYISTILYPGWNPELIIGIKNVPADTLQAGS